MNLKKIELAVFNVDLSNRHELINDSESLSEHLFQRIRACSFTNIPPVKFFLRNLSRMVSLKRIQCTTQMFFLFVSEYHHTAAELLLNKLNSETDDRYTMIEKRFSDDFIAFYFNSVVWRLQRNFYIHKNIIETTRAVDLTIEQENEGRRYSKGVAAILVNNDGRKVLCVTFHLRKHRAASQLNLLTSFKDALSRILTKFNVNALIMCGDYNMKPDVLAQCFKDEEYHIGITSSEVKTTKKNSIDNIVLNKALSFHDELQIDVQTHLSHYPLFQSVTFTTLDANAK